MRNALEIARSAADVKIGLGADKDVDWAVRRAVGDVVFRVVFNDAIQVVILSMHEHCRNRFRVR